MKSLSAKGKIGLSILLVGLFMAGLVLYPRYAKSAALTSARDTLSNSRLSYDASVNGSISSGVTTISIDTESVDDNTTHLFPGDVICFKNAAGTGCKGNTTYTVGSIINSTSFTITSALADNLITGDFVVATQSATHTIVFTTTTAIVDGSVLVKIPASGTTAASNDGFADNGSDASNTQGFDLNSLAAGDVACTGGSPTWTAETITSSVTSTSNEHEIVFPFTGTLASSTTVTCTLTDTLINPAPATDHTQGTADDLQIEVETYDNATPASGVLVDSVDVVVAPIEAVFVSATVDETLSFVISLVNTGATACGVNPDITSTYNTIPFGTLSLNTFVDMAHDLEVSTNASEGYAVTAIQTDQLGKDGTLPCTGDAVETDDCIPDTVGDGSSASHTNAEDWETATSNGFGYSLEETDGTAIAAFEWDDTFQDCDGAGTDFCARQFADEEGGQAAVTIMSNAAPADSNNMYVCYRISVNALQPAGFYYNSVRYTATPIF